jgi:hypothetical protein
MFAIIDSGATSHMWNDRTAFTEFDPLQGSFIRVADDSHLFVEGRGTI